MKRFNETYGKRQFLSRNEWADTYKAIHSESEEKVIVKVLVNKSTDEEYINNLSKEVKIIKEIKNPNLIHINNMFQYSACGKTYYYIESEYFKGISLGEKIENNKLEEKEVINMVKEICESINEFHSNNLSFNILSLENILINYNNQIKIDTLSYLENKRFVENEEENIVKVFNPQSDIYDIGVILYNLLSGKTTFDKNKYKKDIKDKSLLRVIEKATDKNDEYKYKDINRLIIDLKSYLLSGEIKSGDFKEEVKVVQQSKNKKTKKDKIKKEKTKKIQTKELKDKELKRDNKENKKENKKRKKGKFGKTLGICTVITIAAGAGIYAYDFIEKNYKKEDIKVEENVENNKTQNLVDQNENKIEDKTENIKSEESKKENKEEKVDVKKEETKKEDKINKSEKVNSTTKKEETNTNSSSNNSSSNKGNTNNTSKPNNNTVNKPSNNTTNKPSNNTSNSSNNTTNKPNNNTSKPNNNTNKPNNNTTNKPNNNQNSGNTNNKPEIENKPESTTKPDDSNNSGNDNVDEQPPSSEIEGE